MLAYLVICPAVFLAGLIDAIAGGGGLISLPVYFIMGFPNANCIATNKMSACMGTSIATWQYARKKFIPWKLALGCIPMAFVGSFLGANLALVADDRAFKWFMLIVLPVVGLYVLFHKDIEALDKNLSFGKTLLISMVIAFAVGIYDGFCGPGTGTFLILLFTGIAGMKLTKANGLTKAINFTTNISALAVFLIHGQVLFPLGIVAGLFNIAGNYIGSRQFEKGGSKVVRPVILLVLLIFIIKLLFELL